MVELHPWLGDLYKIGVGRELVGLVCILASVICGGIIGVERERRDKPAGVRTVILIAIGSTIFTMVSRLISAEKPTADPARLAAQILPGIGFIGAGIIIHARGMVVGLTTGATIWAVAAVGVTIGAGYVAAGVCFTILILFTLDIVNRIEWLMIGRCRKKTVRIVFRPERGKTLPRIQEILDYHRLPDSSVVKGHGADEEELIELPVCMSHRQHRTVLKELAELQEVVSIQVAEG